MKFNSSDEVIKLVEAKRKNGIELRHFKDFMASIDNPQDRLKCIHVAGTNGKGSTCNDIANILMEGGYKVGMFTSPYLECHRDRIRVNDEFIPDEYIVDKANEYYDRWVEYDLSMFEIDMFIAVSYFNHQLVDYAVFEVGLGGEQDATNIINPMVSVITNIGMDHTEYLGSTLLDITKAKAGIIKDHVPVVSGIKQKECIDLVKKECKKHHCEYIQVKEIKDVFVKDFLSIDYRDYKDIIQDTLAKYQAYNIACAIETVLCLVDANLATITDFNIKEGIKRAKWKGRFEIVHYNPLVIIDGAHNEEGIRALVESCEQYDKMQILFSALKDKPTNKMLDLLLGLSKDIIVTEFDFYRASSAEELAGNHPVKVIKDYKKAIEELLKDEEGLHLICGSLYFISLVREYFKEKGESTI